MREGNNDHSNLRGYIADCSGDIETTKRAFDKALEERSKENFVALFDLLSTGQISIIDKSEKFNAISQATLDFNKQSITEEDIENLRHYMLDMGFSGVVSLSDSKADYILSSENIDHPNIPFAIHSISKLFTEILVIRMIQEGILPKEALDKPIELSPSAIDAIPEGIRPQLLAQLERTTLRKVMLHQGGFRDCFANYTHAIEQALEKEETPPRITKPEDFLKYAESELTPLGPGEDHYSNLGLLLVGLTIHYHYQKRDPSMSYQDILNQYMIKPAKMETFSSERPVGARVNKNDRVAPHIVGGPAGGYWTTASDLSAFLKWVGDQYQNETFRELVHDCGKDFYNSDREEISYRGDISSSSAHVGIFLTNGITISIVSDKGDGEGGPEASVLYSIVLEHVLSQD